MQAVLVHGWHLRLWILLLILALRAFFLLIQYSHIHRFHVLIPGEACGYLQPGSFTAFPYLLEGKVLNLIIIFLFFLNRDQTQMLFETSLQTVLLTSHACKQPIRKTFNSGHLKPHPPCTIHSWQTPVCIAPIWEDDAYCHPSQNWYISIGLRSHVQLMLSSKLLTLDLFSAASSSWSPSSSSR